MRQPRVEAAADLLRTDKAGCNLVIIIIMGRFFPEGLRQRGFGRLSCMRPGQDWTGGRGRAQKVARDTFPVGCAKFKRGSCDKRNTGCDRRRCLLSLRCALLLWCGSRCDAIRCHACDAMRCHDGEAASMSRATEMRCDREGRKGPI